MAKTWDLKDAGLMLDLLAKETREAASRGLLSAAHRAVAHIVGEVIPGLPRQPVDRGIYRTGWRARKDGTGAVVENVTPAAAMIENGVRGANVKIGRAMIDALAKWVRRKGLTGHVVVGKDGSVRRVNASKSEAQSIAWAIAKKMQKDGIFDRGRGLKVLAKASRMFPTFIAEEVGAEMSKV